MSLIVREPQVPNVSNVVCHVMFLFVVSDFVEQARTGIQVFTNTAREVTHIY